MPNDMVKAVEMVLQDKFYTVVYDTHICVCKLKGNCISPAIATVIVDDDCLFVANNTRMITVSYNEIDDLNNIIMEKYG